MAAVLGMAARKLTRTKITAISLAGKALLEEDPFDRVSRDAQGTFSFFLTQAWRVKWIHWYQVFHFLDLLSIAVRPFMISFPRREEVDRVTSMRYHRWGGTSLFAKC